MCEAFTANITARKGQQTTMVVLSGVTQGKNETMHTCIHYSSRVTMAIGGSDESLKCWIFEKGLRSDCVMGKFRVQGSP